MNLDIWSKIYNGIRILDGDTMGLLKKICEILDEAWEDYIYAPLTDLVTIFDINLIDSKWLRRLKPLLGLTSDLSFDASDEELRRILPKIVDFWNQKPSELGSIVHSIRMVTGNQFRVRNFFDFRMVTDETCIEEEDLTYDPWLIDFVSEEGREEYVSEIRIVDEAHGTMSYDTCTIAFSLGEVIIGSESGSSATITEITTLSETTGTLSLENISGRFVNNEEIQGDVGGTAKVKGKIQGVLNRDLLNFFLGLNRPIGERYNIVYTSFLDEFKIQNYLEQWVTDGDIALSDDFGSVEFGAGGKLITATSYAVARDLDTDAVYECGWLDYIVEFNFIPDTSATVFDFYFRHVAINNHFLVRFSMVTKTISLVKVVSGVETLITTSDVIAYLVPSMKGVIRIGIFTQPVTPTIAKITCTYDGQQMFTPDMQSVTWSPAIPGGGVGAKCVTGSGSVSRVEVIPLPTTIITVGPVSV